MKSLSNARPSACSLDRLCASAFATALVGSLAVSPGCSLRSAAAAEDLDAHGASSQTEASTPSNAAAPLLSCSLTVSSPSMLLGFPVVSNGVHYTLVGGGGGGEGSGAAAGDKGLAGGVSSGAFTPLPGVTVVLVYPGGGGAGGSAVDPARGPLVMTDGVANTGLGGGSGGGGGWGRNAGGGPGLNARTTIQTLNAAGVVINQWAGGAGGGGGNTVMILNSIATLASLELSVFGGAGGGHPSYSLPGAGGAGVPTLNSQGQSTLPPAADPGANGTMTSGGNPSPPETLALLNGSETRFGGGGGGGGSGGGGGGGGNLTSSLAGTGGSLGGQGTGLGTALGGNGASVGPFGTAGAGGTAGNGGSGGAGGAATFTYRATVCSVTAQPYNN